MLDFKKFLSAAARDLPPGSIQTGSREQDSRSTTKSGYAHGGSASSSGRRSPKRRDGRESGSEKERFADAFEAAARLAAARKNDRSKQGDDEKTCSGSMNKRGTGFKIGERVRMKNVQDTQWYVGYVVEVMPLRVRHETGSKSLLWDTVKHLEDVPFEGSFQVTRAAPLVQPDQASQHPWQAHPEAKRRRVEATLAVTRRTLEVEVIEGATPQLRTRVKMARLYRILQDVVVARQTQLVICVDDGDVLASCMRADYLVGVLKEEGFQAEAVHSKHDSSQQRHTRSAFTAGSLQVLVSTISDSAGMDMSTFSHIIIYDMCEMSRCSHLLLWSELQVQYYGQGCTLMFLDDVPNNEHVAAGLASYLQANGQVITPSLRAMIGGLQRSDSWNGASTTLGPMPFPAASFDEGSVLR